MLTPKQENFCQLYVKLGNASEAYRQAYNSSAKAQSVAVEASKLMSDPNISLRVAELREEMSEMAYWSRMDSLKVLADIAKGVDSEAKPSDKVAAVKVINSMHGWDKQIIDQTTTHKADKSLAELLTNGSKR
jgi:phage terminase small subunit